MEGHVSLENYRIQILAACTAIMQFVRDVPLLPQLWVPVQIPVQIP